MEIEVIQYPNTPSSIEGKGSVIALGFFDGIHKGHQQLLQTAKSLAIEKDLTFTVMTFFPHPNTIIQPKRARDAYLTPLAMKVKILRGMGVSKLYVIQFTKEFSIIPHDEFVETYLKAANCKHAVVGFDFSYGHRGQGNTEQLITDSNGFFEVTTISKIEVNNVKISSTAIRRLLDEGNVYDIPAYLGKFYQIEGEVESYHSSSNLLTIKMKVDPDVFLPSSGKYAVAVSIHSNRLSGNIHIPSSKSSTLLIDIPTDQLFQDIDIITVEFFRKQHLNLKMVSNLRC